MISSDVLSADDVQIRCSVRKASLDAKNKLSDPEDVLCTLRIWHSPTGGGNLKRIRSATGGRLLGGNDQLRKKCELLIKPIERHPSAAREIRARDVSPQMSRRFSTFGMAEPANYRMEDQQQSSSIGNVKIPISDIMIADMHGDSTSHIANLTTMSHGYFQFTMMNRNGQEILLAFLKANLPKERIMECAPSSELSRTDSQDSTRSFDVEAFTAKNMTERIKNETLSEKVRRKVGRAFASIEELTASMTECACSCGGDNKTSITPAPSGDMLAEKRDSPPSATKTTMTANASRTNTTADSKLCLVDCGLSVESEPDMFELTR